MIGYLEGHIIDINAQEKTLLVFAGQVGYTVRVNTELLSKTRADEKLGLFIHTAVREDDIALYGFETKHEHAFFRQLISVSGVGPRIAMDILSAPIGVTQTAIAKGDADLLTKIKGVGKKTAERIILELKGKVVPVVTAHGQGIPEPQEDAVLALQGLGYEKMQVVRVLSAMPAELKKTEEIVKYFLKQA